MNLSVIQIVKKHLTDNGYTGLVLADGQCGCHVDDLVPCDMDPSHCQAGYQHIDPRPDHKGDWAIFKQKEPPTVEQWERVEY